MSLLVWFVRQVLSYGDWLPWRKVKRALVFGVAVVAVLVPSAFHAAVLAYVKAETARFTSLLTTVEHDALCRANQPRSVKIAFCQPGAQLARPAGHS